MSGAATFGRFPDPVAWTTLMVAMAKAPNANRTASSAFKLALMWICLFMKGLLSPTASLMREPYPVS